MNYLLREIYASDYLPWQPILPPFCITTCPKDPSLIHSWCQNFTKTFFQAPFATTNSLSYNTCLNHTLCRKFLRTCFISLVPFLVGSQVAVPLKTWSTVFLSPRFLLVTPAASRRRSLPYWSTFSWVANVSLADYTFHGGWRNSNLPLECVKCMLEQELPFSIIISHLPIVQLLNILSNFMRKN